MTASEEIRTFAFLTLETTGFPSPFAKTDITEFLLIACSSVDLNNLEDHIDTPRITHMIRMFFNPDVTIDPKAVDVSGLHEDILQDQNKFDKNSAIAILSFIDHLPKPVCLVAHNGNSFHFPILGQQLLDIGVDLPDVLCIDSYRAFQQLDRVDCENITSKEGAVINRKRRSAMSYKLHDIYDRLFSKKAKIEDQIESTLLKSTKLLKIVSSYREHFATFAMEHAKPFSLIFKPADHEDHFIFF